MAKRRIHQNVYGNWYGYEGPRRVIAFYNTIPGYGAQQEAEAWLRRAPTCEARPQQRGVPVSPAPKCGKPATMSSKGKNYCRRCAIRFGVLKVE